MKRRSPRLSPKEKRGNESSDEIWRDELGEGKRAELRKESCNYSDAGWLLREIEDTEILFSWEKANQSSYGDKLIVTPLSRNQGILPNLNLQKTGPLTKNSIGLDQKHQPFRLKEVVGKKEWPIVW